MSLSLQGCGGGGGPAVNPPGPTGHDCQAQNLTCRTELACDGVCDHFNITNKSLAESCFKCVANSSIADANGLCPANETEACVACVVKTSALCWTNPVSIG